MMKKTFLLMGILGVLTASPVLADDLGYVDMQRIMVGYKEARQINQNFLEKRKMLKEEIAAKEAEVEKARKDKKSDDEIKKMTQKFEQELQEKGNAMMQEELAIQQKLVSEIIGVIGKTKKAYGIDVVVDKAAVYSGGFDLTEFVLEKLNS